MLLGDRPTSESTFLGNASSVPLLRVRGLLALKEVVMFGGIKTEKSGGCWLGEGAGLAGDGCGPCC